MGGYLYAIDTNVDAVAGTATGPPTWRLLGGDAKPDCVVDILDLVTVTIHYDWTSPPPPPDTYADINGNGIVDIFDVVMVGVNLDKTCGPPVLASSLSKVRSLTKASLRVMPPRQQGEVGELMTVTLELEDVTDLYGADMRLAFNPDVLEVVDADAVIAGVQVQPGALPDPEQGKVTMNTADNAEGTVAYAVALQQPALPASGDGTLCTITFSAKAPGFSALQISSTDLSNSDADPILVLEIGSWARVGTEYLVWMPCVWKPGPR